MYSYCYIVLHYNTYGYKGPKFPSVVNLIYGI